MNSLLSFLMILLMLVFGVGSGEHAPVSSEEEYDPQTEMCESAIGAVTLELDANITTGLSWSAKITEGDCVEIDETASGYQSDPNPEMLDGVGGTQYYVLNALHSGKARICFSYGYSEADESAEKMDVLVVVDDDMRIHVYCE